MLFNSLEFLFFFLIAFIVYWSIPVNNRTLRNGFLLIASYTFYSYWDWRFLGLILLSTIVDYLSGIQIDKAVLKQKKKVWLIVSLIVNLGILSIFKYFDFFSESFRELFLLIGWQTHSYTLDLILPLGISFYTFQTLSYTIDIYRGQLKPTKNLLQFAVFVSFFPQLVAGPIERARDLLPQFSSAKVFNYYQARNGAFLMIYGYFKKVAVADNLATIVDQIYSNPENYSSLEIVLGLFGFGVQLYADFSGYSDIAIGLAMIFGFQLSTNFKTPLFSKSIKEFWARWHITLYSWFRDYVYIPLGGSRKGKIRVSINILVTFGLSGLWHGAGWNYVLFGLLHGMYYLFEKEYHNKVSPVLSAIITQVLILLAWSVFRQTEFNLYISMWKQLINFDYNFTYDESIIVIIAGVIILFFIDFKIRFKENFAFWISDKNRFTKAFYLYFIIFWTIVFGAFETGQNFIYFQF